MFTPRLTKPEKGNPYYNTRANGGYSTAIKGSPTDPDCDVLANCVGYAIGRFNEIVGHPCCKYLGSTNAENFVTLAKSQGLTVQQQPVIGGCMVWAKGKVGDGSDGAGHVAVVEQINADGSIVTSESGYGYKAFYTTKRSGANWGQGAAYTYLGCIVNPAVCPYDEPTAPVRMGDTGEPVRWLQWQLIRHGCLRDTELDGDFGMITLGALLAYQCINGLELDGVCGRLTRQSLQ